MTDKNLKNALNDVIYRLREGERMERRDGGPWSAGAGRLVAIGLRGELSEGVRRQDLGGLGRRIHGHPLANRC